MSQLMLNEGVAPSTPATGKGSWYVDTSGIPHFLNDDGIDMTLSPNRKFNWVRNSGMWFAQRQAPGTLTTYSSLTGRLISADGWGITNENASAQYQRTDTISAPETGLQGRYYGTFAKITGSGKLAVSQVIEGVDSTVLRGSTVRVQLWIKASTAMTIRVGLVELAAAGTTDTIPATFISAFNANGTDPTLGTNLARLTPKTGVIPENGTVVGSGIDVSATVAWQRVGVCFDAPSDLKNLIVMVWTNEQIAANSFSISQVSLTDGYAIQDWAPLNVGAELARVQRFYAKSFNVDTLPAQNVGLVGSQRGHVNVAGATAGQVLGVRWPVALRAAPTTIVFFNPSAANAFVRNTTGGTDATATASANTGENAMDVTFTGIAAWAVGGALAVHYTADAEL